MKRKPYFPKVIGGQTVWLTNYAGKVGAHATALGLSATETIADAKYVLFILGAWLANVRSYSAYATEYCYALNYGLTGGSTFPVTPYVMPTLPVGVVPVAAGALNRIFKFVQNIKDASGYNVAIGEDLAIIGSEVTPDTAAPKIKLIVAENLPGCQKVKLTYNKSTHIGAYIECRRGGPEAPYEFLGVSVEKVFFDTRPLLQPGVPELREYRVSFWDNEPNGPTTISTITVSP